MDEHSHPVAIVTGATSGIGRAVALGLARRGWRVLVGARNAGRARAALAWLGRRAPGAVLEPLVGDLSRRDEVMALADDALRRARRIDVLVNNAAVLTRARRTTPEGFELQFFVNHLAPFILTVRLAERLVESAPARIVNVASTAHSSGRIDFDDLQMERDYRGWRMYANTKLMNVMFTFALARRLEGTGVVAHCVHPGVIHTGLLRGFSRVGNLLFHALSPFFRGPDEGARTPLQVATAPEFGRRTGCYVRDGRVMDASAAARDVDAQERLWKASEELAGIRWPLPAR